MTEKYVYLTGENKLLQCLKKEKIKKRELKKQNGGGKKRSGIVLIYYRHCFRRLCHRNLSAYIITAHKNVSYAIFSVVTR